MYSLSSLPRSTGEILKDSQSVTLNKCAVSYKKKTELFHKGGQQLSLSLKRVQFPYLEGPGQLQPRLTSLVGDQLLA